MKISLIFSFSIVTLLIFIGCDSKSTEPAVNNYQISTWIAYTNWTQASPPTSQDSALYYYSQIGRIVWYNPFDRVLINDIWPSRDVNAQTERTTDVLAIKYDPNLNTSYSWNGIMRTLPNEDPIPYKTGFIVFWILGDNGTIHIDLGRISEDWWLLDSTHDGHSSLGNLNTEDINFNGFYDEGEDTGVDGISFSEQPSTWPDDRWLQPDRNTNNYSGINGTEGNAGIIDSNPDTEDINQNGVIDLVNDYFEYKFSLDKNSPDSVYIDSLNANGWAKYKIPLSNPYKTVGVPSTMDMEFVRLWIDGIVAESISIYIAQIKFVD